jgi:hypothetical protein
MGVDQAHLTGLDGLLTEASLSVPIAEFLTRNTTLNISGEVGHPNPNFVSKGVGRKRQLDFVAKDDRNKWIFALETKSLPIDRQAFVDDILRLALLGKPDVDRYLLVAGELSDRAWKDLKSARKKAKGKITGATRIPVRLEVNVKGSTRKDLLRVFLGDSYSEKIVDLKKRSMLVRKYIASFQKRYNCNSIPKQYRTTLKSWNRKNRFIAMIWQIRCSPRAGNIDFRF